MSDDSSLPPPLKNFLDARRRLREWARAEGQAASELFDWLDPWPRGRLPTDLPRILRQAAEDGAREALRGSPNVCRYSSEDVADSLQLLVPPGSRASGIKHLRQFTEGAASLTIIDPYFFSASEDQVQKSLEHICDVTRLADGTLKKLVVIHRPLKSGEGKDEDRTAGDEALLSALRAAVNERGIHFDHRVTKKFHDRIWIADETKAVAVGTSFNGIGSRASFILALPDVDLKELKAFLERSGLVPMPDTGT